MVPPKNNQAPKKDNKAGNSWVPRPNGGSAQSGPSVGPKHDSKKRKNAGGNDAAKKKQNTSLELSLFKNDATRPKDGKDKPSGPEVLGHLKSTFELASQVPALRLEVDGYAVVLHVHNFFVENAGCLTFTNQDRIFNRVLIPSTSSSGGEIFSVNGIIFTFTNELDMPELTVKQAEEFFTFGGGDLQAKGDDPAGQKGGVLALKFTLKGRVSPPRMVTDGKNSNNTRALELQRMLNKGPFTFTLVRRFGNYHDELDAYWTHRVRVCAQEGIWAMYNNILSTRVGQRFEAWIENPAKALPHEPWMAVGTPAEHEIQRYESHEARNNFGSMAEWEIVLSAAVIHDVAASVKLNEQYYNWDRTYEAIVRYVKNDYVQLEFDIPSRGELSFPSISGSTRFLVRYGRCTTAEDSNAELENDEDEIENGEILEEEETEASPGAANITNSQESSETNLIDNERGEQSIYGSSEDKVAVQDVVIDGINNVEWTAQVLVAKENKQFVISFTMPQGKKRKFHVGSKVDVQLKVLKNHLATTRQLKAIGMIAENKAKDDTYGRILQRFILGEGMADVKHDIEDHLLSLKEITYNKLPLLNQKVYDQWLESCKLNLMQREAYDAVIEDVLPATIIQGPSGTGKSLTCAVTCIGIAQLGYKVLYATSTNAAAETALLSIFNATQKLFEAVDHQTIGINPAPKLQAEIKESKENFAIIHFPANASTENDFMKRDDERKDDQEDNPLDAYRISNHVIKSFHRKANNPEVSNTTRTKARNWLATLQRVREGKSVAAERFVREGIAEMGEVVRDTHTKIIISTCNNSAALRDMGFQPQVVLVDDASWAREPDCIVPLTFGQAHVVLYGDVEKKGVWPGVKSWGSNEFGAQLSRSLFERLVALGNMAVVRLE
ncbi:uncharacterized protein EAE98_002545 [Botrytis deweyae]|uniref:DNA2/NAM7 helicase helicase domain-containing protein n=1 Tax=Botrytis deweyae TaxID=2478750 RepID=A0ABQ7IXN0_9HELO|nr:uncharacterized protein EAE98_002545 [Botrytis deweyae]KAF7936326.1 hypothetical protein EAE98_002545 [Botrytis deweyae]